MYIKSLQISNTSGLIRNIEFHEGVNLIVDTSAEGDKSGNSVGKTTVLRLIDFCLGANGEKIYKDPEFGTNSQVKSFLLDTQVLITLTLTRRLDVSAVGKIVIERNFLNRSDSAIRINGEDIKKKDFESELAKRIFKYEEAKPTFRQIISKNLRNDDSRLSQILKILHQTTSDIEYQTLFLFWLGIDSGDGDENERTRRDFNRQDTYRKELAKEININSFSVLPDLEIEIKNLTSKRNALDFPDDYQQQLEAFDAIKQRMSQMGVRLGALRLRKQLILDSRRDLEDDLSKISTQEIRALYNEAKLLIPDLQKSFEESVIFHNQMIENKLSFINQELPSLEREEVNLSLKLQLEEENARVFRDSLKSDKTLDKLNQLNSELQKLIERQSRLQEQERLWLACLDELDRLKKRLSSFAEKTKSLNELVDERLVIFNRHFKQISKRLYGESYKLSRSLVDAKGDEIKTLRFTIEGISANPGTGEKKGQITAFDLSYILFAKELGLPHLNFILHDQIENVDGRQIVTILETLVPEAGAQYIAPILRDKIPKEIDLERFSVVELSQQAKLFLI